MPRIAVVAAPLGPLPSGRVKKPMMKNANITLITSENRAPNVLLKSSQRSRIDEPATACEMSSR